MFKKEYDIENINTKWWILENGRGIICSKKWMKCQSMLSKLQRGIPFDGPPPSFLFDGPVLNLDEKGEVY